MKRKVTISLTVITALVVIYLVISSFIQRTDVFLGEYTVADNGTQIDMEVGVASSMGYIGRYSIKQDRNCLYLTFYSANRGRNTPSGGNMITINLLPECDAIYFNRSGGKFQMMLQKNRETNEWERVLH